MFKIAYILSLINLSAIYGSIALTQGIILNRLNLAYAAAPAFVGLAAYFFVAKANNLDLTLIFCFFSITFFVVFWLHSKLPGDYYLISSVALLEIINAVLGAEYSQLGGREGLFFPFSQGLNAAAFEYNAFWVCLGLLVLCSSIYKLVFMSVLGNYIDRVGSTPKSISRWLPKKGIVFITMCFCTIVFAISGYVYVSYTGGITPSFFSIDTAFIFIIFTILTRKSILLGFLFAILYFTLPYGITQLTVLFESNVLNPMFGIKTHIGRDLAADLVVIAWGCAIIYIANKQLGQMKGSN